MKKLNILYVLLLFHTVLYGQLPKGRTTDTKIADVLALQPAAEKGKFLDAMQELKGFSASEIATLLSQLRPQGGGRNPEIEYLTNSYSFYVQKNGQEQDRLTFVSGLIESLNKIKDKNLQGYVLQLIQNCGKDEAVEAVSKYLNDEFLAEKAGRALTSIGSAKAESVLVNALKNPSNEKSAIAIATALGALKSQKGEQAIINLLPKYSSVDFQKTALNALSQIAQPGSAQIFESKIKAANYAYSSIDEMGLALKYAQSLISNNQADAAVNLATIVYNQPNVAPNYKSAALKILAKKNPESYKNTLFKIVQEDNSALYRNTALSLINENWGNNGSIKLISLISKSKPEVQEAILRNIGQSGNSANYKKIEKLAKSKLSGQSKITALTTLNTLDKAQSGKFLIKQLGPDLETNKAIKAILLTSKSANLINEINAALPKAPENVQVELLDVIAQRNNGTSAKFVLPLLDSPNQKVKDAAYKTFASVAIPDNIKVIVERLDRANKPEITYLQDALVQAINTSTQPESEIKTLSKEIASKNESIAIKYLPVFAKVGGTESLKSVQPYLQSTNSGTKDAAIMALSAWNDSEALEQLFQLARKENKNFDSIFKGLIRQISLSEKNADQKTLYLKDAFEIAKTDAQRTAVIKSFAQAPTYQSLVFVGDLIKNPAYAKTATPVAMDIALDNPQYQGVKVKEILNNVLSNLSGSETSYLKEAVRKHLAKMSDVEGYVSVFNGQDLTGWKGLVANPLKRQKMTPKELAEAQVKADQIMREGWIVENGTLVFTGKGDNIATIKEYGDIEMLVDWKLDKDGKEGDAGVYLRGTPQVQIWDTSRVKVGAQVGSGGLYNNKTHPAKPLKVSDNKLGEWNTFKIRMVDDKVTVHLNGDLVTDNVVLENYWDRKQPIFPKEQIELQAHGTKVYYRDIFINELPRKEIFQLSEQEAKEGFKMLFDGSSLDAWIPANGYSINENGHLWVDPSSKFGGNLYTKEEFADFVYRFEFKLTPGANNGIGIRAPLQGDAAYLGSEIQVLDDSAEIYKNLKPYQYHGSVYGVVTAKKGYLKPMGEWNQEEIQVKGNRVKVILNGTVIVDADIKEASKNGTLDGKSHPGLERTSGHIAFLGHGTEVFFRNIRVKKL
ncbi:protein of unknown function DUF1080 [Pseudopedobacter saltans DSM 12145]|uniref:3-keto-alpha-glucoside-1,2-lyase/3-keto-2-hydroxy-glucal hydratase domain-containing protein n=1 Tax=Pseudopedobacter saltans (strain ATCC 51119 / DSM 12145 / JCM 21818 / CCUG 39354 / LMG 10337 / NBRC 100064 / NCIMB 13643) TaxID=762903 RepID=F0S675_PSESL|nr:DUF1080 domain-containing protein [Pseudopedobacter saltans]ADY53189.1 protein of unknown function DUF1080 [Pseudopedobacter saltans DSM 12145]